MFWETEVVEVIVLNLEVLAKRDEDLFGLLEILRGGEILVVEGKSDWKVKGVVRSFVDHNELVFLHREIVQVDLVLWRSEQVAQLAEFGLECDFVEQLDEINVCGVLAEVFLKEAVDGRFKQEGVVDGNHSDVWLAVPAWRTSSSDAAVHDIV